MSDKIRNQEFKCLNVLNDLNAKNLMFNYSINVVSLAYVAAMVAISIGFVRGFLPCLRYFLSDRSEIIEFYFLLFFFMMI